MWEYRTVPPPGHVSTAQHVHSTFTARAHTLQQLEPHSRRPRGTAWVPARGLPDRQMDASREAA